ncbi:MAG TPA: prenyltransferase/squalene oxidase repeat-containing protein [Pirellulales bacterium]|nr:prenyltransferase/squalene oxidase repeat-containing protein [Pirellulales bacterium]
MLSHSVAAGSPPSAADSTTNLSDSTVVDVGQSPPPAVPSPCEPVPALPDDTEPLWATEQVCRFWRSTSSCLVSLVLHALLVIVLGLLAIAPQGHGKGLSLVASTVESSQQSVDTGEFQAESQADLLAGESTSEPLEQTTIELAESVAADARAAGAPTQSTESHVIPDSVGEALADLPAGMLSGEVGGAGDADVTGALHGRNAGVRSNLAMTGGATQASEDAVSRGLRWLQVHQRADGSWCFDLKQAPCEGRCSEGGTEVSSTGATALALLAFLGRGETHFEGDYQDNVKRGLYYLTSHMLITSQGGDLRGEGGGTMYSHGIASIALCEAYAMTHDKTLEPFAQKAIDFIVTAQDPRGGGWRYVPGMPGDTTVSGWQIMALKSGQMAYLRVPYETIERAGRFLDSVQAEKGARYTYKPKLKEGKEFTTSSVGLLCRMYLGWPKDHQGLRRGVELLAREGPSMLGSNSNMYYNYYATQIMHQYGGEQWEAWNTQMRDFLVRTQAEGGHEDGSWYFSGGQARAGGRLYVTAVAIMTLEVYYRHMPLYAPHAVGY